MTLCRKLTHLNVDSREITPESVELAQWHFDNFVVQAQIAAAVMTQFHDALRAAMVDIAQVVTEVRRRA